VVGVLFFGRVMAAAVVGRNRISGPGEQKLRQVDVKAGAVSVPVATAVALPGPGTLSQQHDGQQEECHDTFEHGKSCFDNHPPTSLTQMSIRSTPRGLPTERGRELESLKDLSHQGCLPPWSA
jgi:hypothetical protein